MICRAIPYEGNEPYIFLSYCHKDAERVYPLVEQMVRDGFRIWYDDGNHPGDDWPENIAQHLNDGAICVVFLSQYVTNSHNCRNEINFAVEIEKKIAAVMLEEFSMPLGMQMQLSRTHFLRISEFPSASMMLGKLYDVEEMRKCRTTPGSLPMRPERKEEAAAPGPSRQVLSFIRQEQYAFAKAPLEPPTEVLKEEIKTPPAIVPPENIGELETEVLKPKAEPVQPEPVKEEAPKAEPVQPEPVKEEIPKAEPVQPEPVKEEIPKAEPVQPEPVKEEAPKAEPVQPKPVKEEVPKAEPVQPKPAKEEPPKAQPPKETQQVLIVSAPEEEPVDNATKLLVVPEEEVVDKTVLLPGNERQEEDKTIQANTHKPVILISLTGKQGYVLRSGLIRMGRSEQRCDVVMKNNPFISSHHADIIFYGGHYYLRDADSINGTFLNDEILEKGSRVLLGNPACFRLYDEHFILITGQTAADLVQRGKVYFLRNVQNQETKLLTEETIVLNRSNIWPGGTLADLGISRKKHAQVHLREGRLTLEDMACPNGVFLNVRRLEEREICVLESGDRITLGATTLEVGIIAL